MVHIKKNLYWKNLIELQWQDSFQEAGDERRAVPSLWVLEQQDLMELGKEKQWQLPESRWWQGLGPGRCLAVAAMMATETAPTRARIRSSGVVPAPLSCAPCAWGFSNVVGGKGTHFGSGDIWIISPHLMRVLSQVSYPVSALISSL